MGRWGQRIGTFEALAANLAFSTLIATTVLLALRQSLGRLRRRTALTLVVLDRRRRHGSRRRAHDHRRHSTPGRGRDDRAADRRQLAMGVAIDRYGWFGVDQVALTWPRALGVLLLAAGALLALRR